MMKTAADVEREVEASRSDLDRNVEALKDKMTPGQIFDEASRAMGGAGQQVLSKLLDQIKENPMPLAVMGLGLAWLMAGPSKSSGRSYDGDYRYAEPRSFGADREGLRDRVHALGDKAGEAMSDVKDRVSDLTASARDRSRQAVDGLGERASEYSHRAREGLHSVLDREPLIVGAIGLVVGAAIGASLPNTSVEDRAVGPLRDKVLDKGKDLAQEGLTQASEVAQAVYASAKDEINKAGEEPGADPVQKARDIARSAVQAGKERWESDGAPGTTV